MEIVGIHTWRHKGLIQIKSSNSIYSEDDELGNSKLNLPNDDTHVVTIRTSGLTLLAYTSRV